MIAGPAILRAEISKTHSPINICQQRLSDRFSHGNEATNCGYFVVQQFKVDYRLLYLSIKMLHASINVFYIYAQLQR